jgi:hypothetical protein
MIVISAKIQTPSLVWSRSVITAGLGYGKVEMIVKNITAIRQFSRKAKTPENLHSSQRYHWYAGGEEGRADQPGAGEPLRGFRGSFHFH